MSKLRELIEKDQLEKFELKADDIEEEYENFLIDIVAKIVKLRIEKGLSQKDIAKKIGTKQSAISRFENFSSNPTLKFIFKILKALDAEFEVRDKNKEIDNYEIIIDMGKVEEKYNINSIEKVWEKVS